MSVCLCPSVTSQSCVKTAEQIELAFGTELPSSNLSYTVLKENAGISKNKDTSLWNSSQTLDFLLRHTDRQNVLSTLLDNVDAHSVINWTVVGTLSYISICLQQAKQLQTTWQGALSQIVLHCSMWHQIQCECSFSIHHHFFSTPDLEVVEGGLYVLLMFFYFKIF